MINKLNPLCHPICVTIPKRLAPYSGWHEHIPFAMFLVDLLKPKMIVELGTRYGSSYCAFCQAVKELHLDTACYAVDTWQGDLHSGLYGAEVLADLRMHHDPLYSSFSRLIQSTFDEALEHFANGTINLLHIDGYHTYESVRHDFEAWLPKISKHGVVLLHDTNVRERDFGIRKFWDEIKLKYPHFEFRHGHGLGILAVGKISSKELQELFELSEEESTRIRDFFFQLGHRLTLRVRDKAMASELENQKGELQELKADLEYKNAYIAKLETSLQEKIDQIRNPECNIQHSIVIKPISRYQKVIERVLCTGTRRRYYYELGLTGIMIILKEGWRSFFRKLRIWLRAKKAADSKGHPSLKRRADNAKGHAPEVSIVVLTHNALRYCHILFNSLKKTEAVDYEVVVVDNDSSLFTRLYLYWLFVRGRIQRLCLLNCNTLFAEGNNIGVNASSRGSSYVLLLNSDIEIRDRLWLRKLVDGHRPGASSYGYCPHVWPHADAYCFLIDRNLYLKYQLDEVFPWWWAATKLQSELLRDGFSIRAVREHNHLIYHFWGKSGVPTLPAEVTTPSEQSVLDWFDGKNIELVESVD